MKFKNKLYLNIENLPLSADLKNKVKFIFSDKIGIINAILERYEYRKFGLFCFQSLSPQTTVLFDTEREVSSGGLGISTNRQEALMGSIGEAIERYCMSYVSEDKLIYCRYNEIDNKFKPRRLELYTPYQYKKFKLFLSNPYKDKIHWIKIKSIINQGKLIYWPASLVYLPFNMSKPVAENTSTGLSSHFSIKEAIKRGILEVIERDALMINFYRQLDPPEIDLDSITDSSLKFYIDKIKEKSFNYKLYLLYTDVKIPVCLGYIWKIYKDNLHFGIGACAALSLKEAIIKTIKECLFTYYYSKNLMGLKPKNKFEINALYEHFLFYQDKKFFKLLFKSGKIPYRPWKVSFNYLLKTLKKENLDAFYVDLTTKDVFKTGLRVVRVVIPGMIDINKNYFLVRQAASRFYSVPQKLKLKPRLRKLYNLPHPFP